MSAAASRLAELLDAPPREAGTGARPLARPPVGFLERQRRELRAGGWRAMLRKLRVAGLLLLAIPTVALVRILRPLVLIRFGELNSRRIGHFVANTEVYLCERDAGLHGRRALDLFYYSIPVCNAQLRRMWERRLPIHEFFCRVDQVNQWMPGAARHRVPWRRHGDRDIHGVLAERAPHIWFTPEEEQQGWDALQAMGIPREAPFVCLHVREPAYLDQTYPGLQDWRRHDYRNADIRDYQPAAEALARRGYHVVRLGAHVTQRLATDHPRIIDYAVNGRDDFLDVFLCAHCQFYLGDTSGMLWVPMLFRRPVAIANNIPLEYLHSWNSSDVSVLRLLWSNAEGRLLTFRETLESGVGRFLKTHEYERMGVEPRSNTPEEITELIAEMDARVSGSWRPTQEDQELQRRFWSLFRPSELNGVIRASVGAAFLRRHRALLE